MHQFIIAFDFPVYPALLCHGPWNTSHPQPVSAQLIVQVWTGSAEDLGDPMKPDTVCAADQLQLGLQATGEFPTF